MFSFGISRLCFRNIQLYDYKNWAKIEKSGRKPVNNTINCWDLSKYIRLIESHSVTVILMKKKLKQYITQI